MGRRVARGSTWDVEYARVTDDTGDWYAWDGGYVVRIGNRPWIVVAG